MKEGFINVDIWDKLDEDWTKISWTIIESVVQYKHSYIPCFHWRHSRCQHCWDRDNNKALDHNHDLINLSFTIIYSSSVTVSGVSERFTLVVTTPDLDIFVL